VFHCPDLSTIGQGAIADIDVIMLFDGALGKFECCQRVVVLNDSGVIAGQTVAPVLQGQDKIGPEGLAPASLKEFIVTIQLNRGGPESRLLHLNLLLELNHLAIRKRQKSFGLILHRAQVQVGAL